jgi:hypothetical protein
MFFDVLHTPKNTAKQLKLRDPSESLISMPKLVYERKSFSMHKIIRLSFILGV